MTHPPLDFGPLLPELILVGAGLVLLLVEAIFKRLSHTWLAAGAFAGIVAAGWASVWLWDWTPRAFQRDSAVLGGMVAADRFSVVARLVLLAVAAIGIAFGHHYFGRTGEDRGEFYALVLLCTSGMTLIASANNLIVVFLALEILSLSLYVLTGFSFRLTATEGAMKYFLLGAFSSAFFLYGIAMAYGATDTTSITGIARSLSGRVGSEPLALAAAGLLAVGFAFKVAAVPFHTWAPDAYQGAPTPVTAYMSAATKVAAFAALLRVFNVAFAPLQWDWTPFIWVLAAVSMVVGSVIALSQTDIKRMLAYSSVAQAGFILTGVTVAGQRGISASMFYLVAYAAMIVGAFGIVMVVSVRGEERTSISSYAGLARAHPVLAGALTLFLASLAGLPPTAGFIAKASVFGAAVQAGEWPLVLIAVLASVIAAFFYLRVIVIMYTQEPPSEAALIERARGPGIGIAVAGIATLVLGIFPGILYHFIDQASVLRW
jgi:NADH-quinone oxidoreductase subunit N